MVQEIYARHGRNHSRDAASVERAIERLSRDGDYGECFPVGVYDPGANEVHVPDEEPADVRSPDYRLEVVRETCRLPEDHAFAAVHERRFVLDDGEGF